MAMMIRLAFIAALLLALPALPALPELPELPELPDLPALPELAELPVLHAAQQSPAMPTGDAKRGQDLYDKTCKCCACHGYDGQTGNPRLVPMNRAQIASVRKPATPQMPKLVDPPEKDLVDVYAYIRSIPVAAAPAESIPLLKGVIKRRSKGN
jgi:cytochrome c553